MLHDGLEYLPPQTERRLFYGPYNKLPETPVRLTVTYNRKEHAKKYPEFSETFTLDRMQFEGLIHSTPYERQVLHAADAIAKHLKDISQEAKRVNRYDFGNEVRESMPPDPEAIELLRQLSRGELLEPHRFNEANDSPRRLAAYRWLREKLRILHR